MCISVPVHNASRPNFNSIIINKYTCHVPVAYSPPPPPPPPHTHLHRVTSGHKTNIPLDLLPRALAKRAVSGDKNTTSGASGEGNKLSNDDLLAKK